MFKWYVNTNAGTELSGCYFLFHLQVWTALSSLYFCKSSWSQPVYHVKLMFRKCLLYMFLNYSLHLFCNGILYLVTLFYILQNYCDLCNVIYLFFCKFTDLHVAKFNTNVAYCSALAKQSCFNYMYFLSAKYRCW